MLNIDLNDNVHTITIIIITIFLHKIVVKYKLLNHTFHYDTRKYSFSACIVNIWNSLPNYVVDVDTVCLFKTRLDKFWMHQLNSTQLNAKNGRRRNAPLNPYL